MPRVVRDSEEDIDTKSSLRRTRASITANMPDSPIRRSTRNKQNIVVESSPESLDDMPVARTTRSRAATLDKGMTLNPKNLRSRKNSASSDQSESMDVDIETTQRRVTRQKASTVSNTVTPTKPNLRTRSVRAGSESKSTPPVTRAKRVTRASSVDPVGNFNDSSETTFKRHTRASIALVQPTVIEEEIARKRNSKSLESNVIEINESEFENSTSSSKESTKNSLKNMEDEGENKVDKSVNDLEKSTLDASMSLKESVKNKLNVSNEMVEDLESKSLIIHSNKMNLESSKNDIIINDREINVNSSVEMINQNTIIESNDNLSSINEIESEACKYTKNLSSTSNINDDENLIIDVEELSEPSLIDVSVVDVDSCNKSIQKIEQVKLEIKDAYVKLDREQVIEETLIEKKNETNNYLNENQLDINISENRVHMYTAKVVLNDCIKSNEVSHVESNTNKVSLSLENRQENVDLENCNLDNKNELNLININNNNNSNNNKTIKPISIITNNDERENSVFEKESGLRDINSISKHNHEKQNSFSVNEKNEPQISKDNLIQDNQGEMKNLIIECAKGNENENSIYINETYNKSQVFTNVDVSNDDIKDSISIIECIDKINESESLYENNNKVKSCAIKNMINKSNEHLLSINQEQAEKSSITEISDTHNLQNDRKENSLLQHDKKYKDSNSITEIIVEICRPELETINNRNEAVSSFIDKGSIIRDIDNINEYKDKRKDSNYKNLDVEINSVIPFSKCNKNMEINRKNSKQANIINVDDIDNEVISDPVDIELYNSEDSAEIEILDINDETDPKSNQNKSIMSEVDKNGVPSAVTGTDAANSSSPEKDKGNVKTKEKSTSNKSLKKNLDKSQQQNESKIMDSESEDDSEKLFQDIPAEENPSMPEKVQENEKSKEKSTLNKSLKRELDRSQQRNESKIVDSQSENDDEKMLQDTAAEENSSSSEKVKGNEKSKRKSTSSKSLKRVLDRSQQRNASKIVDSESESDGEKMLHDTATEENSSSPEKVKGNEKSKRKSTSSKSLKRELDRSQQRNASKIVGSEFESDGEKMLHDTAAEENSSSPEKVKGNEKSKRKSTLNKSLKTELDISQERNKSKIVDSESEDYGKELFQDIPAEEDSSSSEKVKSKKFNERSTLNKSLKTELDRSQQRNQSRIVDSESEDDSGKLFQEILAEEKSLSNKSSKKELKRSQQKNINKTEDSESEDDAEKLFQDVAAEENSSSPDKLNKNKKSNEKSSLSIKSLKEELNRSDQSNQIKSEDNDSEDDAKKLFQDIPADHWHCENTQDKHENESILEVNVAMLNKKNTSNFEESYTNESNSTTRNKKSQEKPIDQSLIKNISHLNDTEVNNSLSNNTEKNESLNKICRSANMKISDQNNSEEESGKLSRSVNNNRKSLNQSQPINELFDEKPIDKQSEQLKVSLNENEHLKMKRKSLNASVKLKERLCEEIENKSVSEKLITSLNNSRMSKNYSLSNSYCKTIATDDSQSSEEPMEINEESNELQTESQENTSFTQTENTSKKMSTSLNISNAKIHNLNKSFNDSSIKCTNKRKDKKNLSYVNAEIDDVKKNKESNKLITLEIKNRKSLPNQSFIKQDINKSLIENLSTSLNDSKRKKNSLSEKLKKDPSPETKMNGNLEKEQNLNKPNKGLDQTATVVSNVKVEVSFKNLDKSVNETVSETPQRKSLHKSPRISNVFIEETSDTGTEENVPKKRNNQSLNSSVEHLIANKNTSSKTVFDSFVNNIDNEHEEKTDLDCNSLNLDKSLQKSIELAKYQNPPKDSFSITAEGNSNSDSDQDKTESSDSENDIDSDIAKEYNLAGKDVSINSEENIPGDECRESEEEFSDSEDDGTGLEDFIVSDHDTVEDEEDEEDEIENEETEEEIEDGEIDVEKVEEKQIKKSKSSKNSINNSKTSTNILKICSSSSSGSESDDEETSDVDKEAFVKEKSLNHSKLIKDKSLDSSQKNQYRRISSRLQNSDSSSSESKYEQMVSSSENNKDIKKKSLNNSKLLNSSLNNSKATKDKSSKNKNATVLEKDHSNNSSSESEDEKMSSNKLKDYAIGYASSSTDTESESGEDSYIVIDVNKQKTINDSELNFSKQTKPNTLIECSTPKPGVTQKTANSFMGKHNLSTATNKSRRKSGSLNDLTDTKNISTRYSIDENVSKSVVGNTTAHEASITLTNNTEIDDENYPEACLKNRQPWKLIPLNKTAHVREVDTPGTKFLKKSKLNDSFPILESMKSGSFTDENKSKKDTSKSEKRKSISFQEGPCDKNVDETNLATNKKTKKRKIQDLTNTTAMEDETLLKTVLKNRKKMKVSKSSEDETQNCENEETTEGKKKKKKGRHETAKNADNIQKNKKKKKKILNESNETLENTEKKKKKKKKNTEKEVNESVESTRKNKKKKKDTKNESNESVENTRKNKKKKNSFNVSIENVESAGKNNKKKSIRNESIDTTESTLRNKKKNNAINESTQTIENTQKNNKKKDIIDESTESVESTQKSKKKKSKKQAVDTLQGSQEESKQKKAFLEVSFETDETVNVESSQTKKKNKERKLENDVKAKEVMEKSIENGEGKKSKKKKLRKSNEEPLDLINSEKSNSSTNSDSLKKGIKPRSSQEKESIASQKNSKHAGKQIHKEHVERLTLDKKKNSLKRLSDEVIAQLTDEPLQRPIKRQKLLGNKERNIMMPSTSMFSPGKPAPVNLNVEDGYVPLSSVGGTTEFGVVNLEKVKKITKRGIKALNFREKMLARNPRQATAMYLAYLQKQKGKTNV